MIISKSPAGKFMLGIDLTDEFCQISYLYNKRVRFGRGFVNAATGGVSREPVTFSTVPGQENYNIPMAICRLEESGMWVVGREAVEAGQSEEGTVVTGLLQKAREESMVRVNGEEYSSVSLLALYLRRCLALLEPEIAPEQIASITFTASGMDYALEQILQRAVGRMEIPVQQVQCESHQESFYSYMLLQDAEQRRSGMLLCEYEEDGTLLFSLLQYNRRTSPVVFWAKQQKRQLSPSLYGSGRDHAFAQAAQEILEEQEASVVYLTGDGFAGGWMKETAVLLCRGRRVFQGENLFSKGAAYSALLHVDRPREIPESVFLSPDALRSNIGIEVLMREQTGYHVLLDAGTKWYNAEIEEDFILEDGDEFSLVQTPVTGGEAKELTVQLSGLPERPDRTTRLRVLLTMPAADCLQVQIRDLGFGEIFPASGNAWEQTFEV